MTERREGNDGEKETEREEKRWHSLAFVLALPSLSCLFSWLVHELDREFLRCVMMKQMNGDECSAWSGLAK